MDKDLTQPGLGGDLEEQGHQQPRTHFVQGNLDCTSRPWQPQSIFNDLQNLSSPLLGDFQAFEGLIKCIVQLSTVTQKAAEMGSIPMDIFVLTATQWISLLVIQIVYHRHSVFLTTGFVLLPLARPATAPLLSSFARLFRSQLRRTSARPRSKRAAAWTRVRVTLWNSHLPRLLLLASLCMTTTPCTESLFCSFR